MMTRYFGFFLLGVLSILSGTSALAQVEWSSGPEKVPLVELYSSEGCSSCPPADRWFSRLKDDAGLWRDFVPVVFHVTYWDYLGWKDRLAQEVFSQRQRAYATQWQSDTVYTPGVVFDGQEWRGWHRSRRPDRDAPGSPGTLQVTSGNEKDFQIEFRPENAAGKNYEIHGALLGMGIEHAVSRGENRGENLQHDFIVLDWQKKTIQPGSDGVWRAEVRLQNPAGIQTARQAAAFWISERLRPVQAAGGYLSE